MTGRVSTLVGERVVLRRARPEDVQALFDIMSDVEVMRFWSTLPHESIDQTQSWLEAMMAAPTSTSEDFIIERDGVVIGKLGAWRLPEIGFLLARSQWGKGLAQDALQTFVRHMRDRGQTHLTADVDPQNLPCLRLLERSGFRRVGEAAGTYTVGDRLCDSVYLTLDLGPAH